MVAACTSRLPRPAASGGASSTVWPAESGGSLLVSIPTSGWRRLASDARRPESTWPPAYDPGEQRRAEKIAKIESTGNTFAAVAREWFALFAPKWVETHSSKVLGRLENDLLPWLGTLPIRDITAPEVLTVLRRVASRGADETARRALQDCGRVFRYAVSTGRADRDPAGISRARWRRGLSSICRRSPSPRRWAG